MSRICQQSPPFNVRMRTRGERAFYLWCVQENALSELPSPYLHFKGRAAGDGGSRRLISAKHRLCLLETSHTAPCRARRPNFSGRGGRDRIKKCQTVLGEKIQVATKLSGDVGQAANQTQTFPSDEEREHTHTFRGLDSLRLFASSGDTMSPHAARLRPYFAFPSVSPPETSTGGDWRSNSRCRPRIKRDKAQSLYIIRQCSLDWVYLSCGSWICLGFCWTVTYIKLMCKKVVNCNKQGIISVEIRNFFSQLISCAFEWWIHQWLWLHLYI